jgi:hypothetical protein
MNHIILKEVKKLLSEMSGEKLGDMEVSKIIHDGVLDRIEIKIFPKKEGSLVKLSYAIVNTPKNTDESDPPKDQ